nr:hypothetical protein [Tanacetum cinerariifolium]
MASKFVQKKLEEKQLEEERVAKAQNWKLPICYDDDDDEEGSNSLDDNIISRLPLFSAITPNEPVLSTEEPDNSLSMGDEHLDTIPATESDEVIKSSVENLIPIPSESEGILEHMCDASPPDSELVSSEVMEIFIPKVLFDAEYKSDSSDDQSCSKEDVLEKIVSNPLFEENIIPMKIDQHPDNAESALMESLRTHDSSLPISFKIDSLLDEFAGELTLLKSILSGIDETDCDFKEDIHLIKKLLYDNSSSRPPKEFVSANFDAESESFSPSPILVKDSDSLMEEIDIFCEGKPRKGQNRIKTEQKTRSVAKPGSVKAISVKKERKNEDNTKRRAKFPKSYKVIQALLEERSKTGARFVKVWKL